MFFALLFFHYQLTNKNATGFITSRKKKKEKKKKNTDWDLLPCLTICVLSGKQLDFGKKKSIPPLGMQSLCMI